jgi:hypothetical protein
LSWKENTLPPSTQHKLIRKGNRACIDWMRKTVIINSNYDFMLFIIPVMVLLWKAIEKKPKKQTKFS